MWNGKIFIYDVAGAIRILTGEKDDSGYEPNSFFYFIFSFSILLSDIEKLPGKARIETE